MKGTKSSKIKDIQLHITDLRSDEFIITNDSFMTVAKTDTHVSSQKVVEELEDLGIDGTYIYSVFKYTS
jgi:hypothetical protein